MTNPVQYPMYPPPQPYRTNEAAANTALICGIVGIFFLGIALGPVAIVFGCIGNQQSKEWTGKSCPKSIWGICLGVFTLLWGVLWIFLFLAMFGVAAGSA